MAILGLMADQGPLEILNIAQIISADIGGSAVCHVLLPDNESLTASAVQRGVELSPIA